MYLIERKNRIGNQEETFVVFGSTGNVYHVHICKIPTCTCPDFLKGNLCKHIVRIENFTLLTCHSYLYY